jgi:hypothetical protein
MLTIIIAVCGGTVLGLAIGLAWPVARVLGALGGKPTVAWVPGEPGQCPIEIHRDTAQQRGGGPIGGKWKPVVEEDEEPWLCGLRK